MATSSISQTIGDGGNAEYNQAMAWMDLVRQVQEANAAYFANLNNSIFGGPSLLDAPYGYSPDPLSIPYSGGAGNQGVPTITGIQNVINKYGNLPRVYGTYKMRPPLAAQFVNVVQNNETYAMGLFCLGYGPLDITDIKIGDKAIGTISGCTYEVLYGNSAEEVITVFNPDFADLSVNQALGYNSAQVRTAPQAGIQLQIDISFPNGLTSIDAAGVRSATTVEVKVEYSTDGTTWTNLGPENGLTSDPCFTVTDNTLSVVRRSRVVTLATGTYQVRVTRLTADSTSSSLINACTWNTLRAFGSTPSVNPHRDRTGAKIPLAYIALKIKASDTVNGQLEDLNCIVKSKLNTWTGSAWTTEPVITNNPAWVFADLLTGTCNKRAKSKTSLDGNQLKAWADFCDAQGFTYNNILDGNNTINLALREVAIAGRASIFNNDGKYGVVIDQKQTEIVQHFTPRNTYDFELVQTFPETPNALKMRFNNASADYASDERVVYDDGYNSDGTNGLQVATESEGAQLGGVTSPDHAWKLGRYFMAQGRLRRRVITFSTDIEHMVCQRFDMIALTHDIAKFGLGQGYIKSVTLDGSGNCSALTLDDSITMVNGTTYSARLRYSDLSSARHTLTTIAGTSNTIHFATPIDSAADPFPEVGNLVMLGTLNSESAEMIVTAIEPGPDKSARITCVDHAPAIYDAASGTIPAFESGITDQPIQQQIVPVPVLLSSRTDENVLHKDTDGSLQSRIQLVMQSPPANVQYFQVQIRLNDATTWSAPQVFPVGNGEIFLGPVIDGRTYDIEVRHVTFASRRSEPLAITGVLVTGKTTPPPDVPNLDRLGTTTNILSWTYNATTLGQAVPLDFAGFRLKWNNGANDNWASATVAADLIVATQFDMATLPKGPLTIMLKAVDTAGNESTNAALLLKDFGDQTTSNVILTTDHHPDWTIGTATNGTVVDDELQATDDGGLFYGADDNARIYAKDDAALFYTLNYFELAYEWTTVIDPINCPPGTQAPELIIDVEQESERFTLEYRNLGSSLFYDIGLGADSLPFYGSDDGATFYDPLQPFAPWPGRITTGIDTYFFKATCSASRSTQGKLITLTEKLDVPDVTEYIDNATIGASGERLALTKAYRGIKNVQLTWQQDAGDVGSYPFQPTYSDKSVAGPYVLVYDRTGTTVEAKIDALIQGY